MNNFTLQQLTELIMKQAKEKGFGTRKGEIEVAEKMALIHSEIAEAFAAYRHKKINGKHGMAEELADAIVRILHLSGVMGINIEKEVMAKLAKNKDRQWDWEKMNEKHS